MHRPFAKRLAPLVGAAASLVVLTGCSPDITRQRVEDDLSTTWANQYSIARGIEGKAPSSVSARASCDKGGPKVPDRGPGKNWVCMIRYAQRGSSRKQTLRYEVAVRGEACYTAILPALIEKPTINDPRSGKTVPNPIEAFDGCFDVYDNKNRTSPAVVQP